MSLIKSISGIRGTIGGKTGEGLGSVDIVKFTSAFAEFIRREKPEAKRIVVGRDARLSGKMVEHLVVGSLLSMGFDVINIGMATTPTTEIAVVGTKSDGGIILTASHNPKEWNALKLLNSKGEFLNDNEGKKVIEIAESSDFEYNSVDNLGREYHDDTWGERHIEKVKSLPLVNVEAIKKAGFTVAVDAVNSIGGLVIPELLRALGVDNIIELNCEANGKFAHNPEPIPANLEEISELMKSGIADVGFVVDPDVDRLAIVMENGEMFVEEYTLVAVADYVLSHNPGSTVSNLSSSRALADISNKYGCSYSASAVGEVNVVSEMKKTNAVIGGEGNGGVIYPEIHYGRDALVGVALFLSLLAESGKKVSQLKEEYPKYHIVKNKITLTPDIEVEKILNDLKNKYSEEKITDIDGVKIDYKDGWVHLRRSNTEPIIRVYSEASTPERAQELAEDVMKIFNN